MTATDMNISDGDASGPPDLAVGPPNRIYFSYWAPNVILSPLEIVVYILCVLVP